MFGNYAPFYRPNYYPTQQMPFQNPGDNSNQFNFQMPSQPSSDMIWVLNENEATSYPVAPNNTVPLWDKNMRTIYLKSVDANGVPAMRIFDINERTISPKSEQDHICQCEKDFVKIQDFNDLKSKFENLNLKIDDMSAKLYPKSNELEGA